MLLYIGLTCSKHTRSLACTCTPTSQRAVGSGLLKNITIYMCVSIPTTVRGNVSKLYLLLGDSAGDYTASSCVYSWLDISLRPPFLPPSPPSSSSPPPPLSPPSPFSPFYNPYLRDQRICSWQTTGGAETDSPL